MRSRDPRSWMWAEALDLLQSAERLQRQFFQLGAGQGAPTWEPPVDLYETGNELWILVALPGVTTDQLEVVIDGATIVVRGERPLPLDARGGTIPDPEALAREWLSRSLPATDEVRPQS